MKYSKWVDGPYWVWGSVFILWLAGVGVIAGVVFMLAKGAAAISAL